MDSEVREQTKQLRHFVRLKESIKKERKAARSFDIAAHLPDTDAQLFWCRHFGGNARDVPILRFVEALLSGNPLFERSRREQQAAMSSTMCSLLDQVCG